MNIFKTVKDLMVSVTVLRFGSTSIDKLGSSLQVDYRSQFTDPRPTKENHLFTFWIVGQHCCSHIRFSLRSTVRTRLSMKYLKTVGRIFFEKRHSQHWPSTFAWISRSTRFFFGITQTLTRIYFKIWGFQFPSLWFFSCIHYSLKLKLTS